MTDKPRIRILISCHKPTAYIKNSILQPIQLGSANAKTRLPGMLHDDEGDNISELNPKYCELTAQYWAWKNLDADYYGFCHYRRYFNFSNQTFKEDEYGNILEYYPGDYISDKYGLSEESISKAIDGYDLVITERKDVRKIPKYYRNIRDHYQEAPFLVPQDLDTLLSIIDEKTPEYSSYARRFLRGKHTSFCNMYIMKKELFFDYCEWLFSILNEFCDRTDMTKYGPEAQRTPGHLSERLFGIYLARLRKEQPNLKIKELQSVYFQKTDPQSPLEPAFKQNNVPIVLAANNSFVPVFATCLQSILDTSSQQHNYDIVLIQSDLTPENQTTLLGMTAAYPNVSLRFFDASALLADYKLEAKEHISVETYYRFLIQDAMPSYDKVLYIDCDTIVLRDLADLYATDLGNHVFAAAKDPDFIGQVNGANKATKPYAQNQLNLEDPYSYFQAGVILFSEKAMRKLHSVDEWLEIATYPYRYSDQDVLNVVCQGKIKPIDMKWNMITDCNHERINNVIKYAPVEIYQEYLSAHAAPYIIHYAGFMKPWYNPTEDYAREFWQVARKTPYYEELLFNMQNKELTAEITALARGVSIRGRYLNRAKRVYHRLAKKGSRIDRNLRMFSRRIRK